MEKILTKWWLFNFAIPISPVWVNPHIIGRSAALLPSLPSIAFLTFLIACSKNYVISYHKLSLGSDKGNYCDQVIGLIQAILAKWKFHLFFTRRKTKLNLGVNFGPYVHASSLPSLQPRLGLSKVWPKVPWIQFSTKDEFCFHHLAREGVHTSYVLSFPQRHDCQSCGPQYWIFSLSAFQGCLWYYFQTEKINEKHSPIELLNEYHNMLFIDWDHFLQI